LGSGKKWNLKGIRKKEKYGFIGSSREYMAERVGTESPERRFSEVRP
jgi:hypothetical protein